MTLQRITRDIEIGGAREDRTPDLLRARQALSQLSYGPFFAGLFHAMPRCPCHSLGHIREYAPSLAPADALPSAKNPAQKPHLWFSARFDFCVIFADWIFESVSCALSTCAGSRTQAAEIWWVWVDLNHRPHPYQGCALTN